MVQIKGLGVTGTSTGSVLQALGGPRFYCIQSYQFSLVTPYSKQNHCQTPTPLGDNPLKILKMGQSFPIGMIGICRIHRISKSTPKLLKHGAKHGARSEAIRSKISSFQRCAPGVTLLLTRRSARRGTSKAKAAF